VRSPAVAGLFGLSPVYRTPAAGSRLGTSRSGFSVPCRSTAAGSEGCCPRPPPPHRAPAPPRTAGAEQHTGNDGHHGDETAQHLAASDASTTTAAGWKPPTIAAIAATGMPQPWSPPESRGRQWSTSGIRMPTTPTPTTSATPSR
jgi:hypothetical protein